MIGPMPDRLVITIGTNGAASVTADVVGETSDSPSDTFNLVWPIDTDSAEELRLSACCRG